MQKPILAVLALAALAAAPPPSPLRRLASLPGAASCLAFSNDSKLLATGESGYDAKTRRVQGTIRLWDTATGKPQGVWKGHRESPAALAFAPGDKTLIAVTRLGERIVWDTATGKQISTFPIRQPAVIGSGWVGFSADGKSVGVCGQNQAVVWDAVSGKEKQTYRWPVYSLCGVLNRDLRRVAVGNHQDVDLWDRETGKLVHGFLDHPGNVSVLGLSRDDKRLAVGCSRMTQDRGQRSEVWIWDASRGKRDRAIPLGALVFRGLALSPTGDWVAVLGSRGPFASELCLFDTATGAERAHIALRQVPNQSALAVSPDGRRLAAVCEGGVRLWEVRLPKTN